MFGIGKAFKKAWKGTVGKLEDAVDPYKRAIVGAAIGGLVGGPLGAAVGGFSGYQMDVQGQQQQAMINAQLAAADKIAAAQQAAPTIQGMAAPTATAQEASVAEQNNATNKRKAFSFAKTARAGSVQRRNTLG